MRLQLALWGAVAVISSATAEQGSTGAIVGRVSYVGRLPDPVYVFESGNAQPILALDAAKGLSGAVVSIDSPPQRLAAASAAEVTVNQRNWWFTPATVAVLAGQPVRFTNDDPSNHSVRSTTGVPANRFGAYTGTGQPYVHRFRANPDGSPAVITCDIHAWMLAWVYVFDHPHFAMTDASGEFAIRSLPSGKYRLSVRHGPSGLASDQQVAVTTTGEARVDVVFDTPDLKPPNR